MNKYVKDFTLRLNSITATGGLYAVQATEAAVAKARGQSVEIVSCTPDGRPVRQMYVPTVDAEDGEAFFPNQLEKATVDSDGKLHLVGQENLDAAKASSLPLNVMNLTVHEEADLDDQTWHSNHKAYIFVPHAEDDANVQWHNLIQRLVAESGKAFCGMAVVRSKDYGEAFYRLRLWRGYICIERQVSPEEINAHEQAPEGGIKDSTFQKAMTAVANMVAPFDPEDYSNKAAAAVAALNEQAVSGDLDIEAVSVEKAEVEEFDIDAALDGFGEM